ncbi:hypothetical protein [Psychromonas aquimarina]|uniref:hypothetical protein n=1 Tax=Psychromonas aquimarina TaxID=444919 RepID=UPI000427CCD9|nr:hypothetical protein [Psychromonas aquimarina]
MMHSENIISLYSRKILAQVCFQAEKHRLSLRPCEGEALPETANIECYKDLSEFTAGQRIEVEVIEMNSANGNSYFYSY